MTTRALLEGWASLAKSGEELIIATVVDVRGSSYRRPGARMLVSRERWISGSVSGGCLEGDIIQRGFWRTSQGPIVMTYDSRTDADAESDDELRAGLGLGCNGVVDVLIERAGASAIDPLAVLEACVRTQTCAVVATAIASDTEQVPLGTRLAIRGDELFGAIGDDLLTTAIVASAKNALRARTTSIATYGGVRVLLEVFVPPPRLFILGGGHDAVPLATMARAIGWQVFVCLPHARPAAHERFAQADGFVFGPPADVVRAIDESDRAAAVIMHHNYTQDREALGALAASNALYIGVLGPRHRTARMLGELEIRLDPRMHAPVGLALGAETPEEIAVSIVAEVQAVLAEAPASRLRDRVGPIHAPVELTRGASR
jgi:xanthine/CO dehydrogenase XdhC/CoxF family maturation factor